MVGSLLGWVFAFSAGVAALMFLQRFRAEAARVKQLEGEVSESRAAVALVQQREAQRGDQQKKRNDELAELRKRIDKLKKRADQSRSEQQDEGGQLARLAEQLEQARADHRSAREELEGARTELARTHAELERTRTALEGLQQQLATRPLADAASLEKLAALEQKAKRAEDARAQALEAAARAKHDETRHKKRADNLDKVYMVLRGEHEILKDRSRVQTAELERLRALRVALADGPVSEPETAAAEQAPGHGVRPATRPLGPQDRH